MTARERAERTITHSTPVSIALLVTLLGGAFSIGMVAMKVVDHDRNIDRLDTTLARISEAVQSNAKAIDRLTFISDQQTQLLREMREGTYRP